MSISALMFQSKNIIAKWIQIVTIVQMPCWQNEPLISAATTCSKIKKIMNDTIRNIRSHLVLIFKFVIGNINLTVKSLGCFLTHPVGSSSRLNKKNETFIFKKLVVYCHAKVTLSYIFLNPYQATKIPWIGLFHAWIVQDSIDCCWT